MAEARPRRRLRLALGIAVLLIAVLALTLWASRRIIARELLVGWLKARGVPAEAVVSDIGLGGVSGRVQVGKRGAPDFVAGDAEVLYGFRGLTLEVRSVTLKRPLLRGRFHAGRLTLGALDPILDELRKRPPRPNAALPRVRIEDGAFLLTTDYGPVAAHADVLVEDGKLMSLAARTDPARLTDGRVAADLGAGRLSLVTRGGRAQGEIHAPIRKLSGGGAELGAGDLRVTLDGPYPDFKRHRGDGKFALALALTAERASFGGRSFDGIALAGGYAGDVTGWITDLAVSGRATADLTARGGELGGARSGPARVALASEDLRWSRPSGRLAGGLRATATADRVTAADLTLTQLVATGAGPFSADAGGVRLGLGGSVLGRGRWTALGPPTSADSAQIAALKRAARSFRIAAPAVQVSLGPSVSGRLVQPLVLSPDSGGQVRIAMAGETARIAIAGGGLPKADAVVRDLRFAGGQATAALDVVAGFSIGPIVGGNVDAAGRATFGGGGLSFAASRCAPVKVERLEFGDKDVERLSGRLCPAGGPMLTVSNGGWRIAGRGEGLAATAPWLQARLSGGAGPVRFGFSGGRLSADLTAQAGQVVDAAEGPRFNPLALLGRAQLVRDVWTADLAFRTPAGAQVATARLRHEALTGKGGVEIETGMLRFADGGLQPAQLSPLAEGVGSPATGEASFSGVFAWQGEAASSSGTLKIPRLDFKSPAGPVSGLSGEVVFTSLAPLVAAPGQTLRAERLDALVPLTNLQAGLSIQDETLRIAGGEAAVEGGRVLVERLEIPLKPGAATRGVLVFEGVQLKNLVEASPFGGWMDMEAKVSGRIPFETAGGSVRIAEGELHAIEPGRLTIRRELFSGMADGVQAEPAAGAPAEGVPAGPFTDMAYQAMENLAFTQLDATVNSQPNGRLGVLFHIKGRHDPPQKQQIRMSIMDLIKKRFMEKPLPLPSGTEVNLTLDTTLNLDQLLADYADFRQTRGSAQVQP